MTGRAILWALLLALAACAPFPPAPSKLAAVAAGKEALLLFRTEQVDDVGRITPMPLYGKWSPVLRWGGFNSAGRPVNEEAPTSLSADASREGWAVRVLPPGYYYLGVFEKVGAENHLRPVGNTWRAEVPRRVPVIYAGTLRLTVSKRKVLWFSESYVVRTPPRLVDESAAAAAVVARDLPDLPAPVTRLFVRQEGPILLGTPPR